MFSRLTIALFSLLLIQACAQTQQAREVQSSGFLGTDYARLKEGNEGEALLVYKNANVNLAKYDKVRLDPVTIWMSGNPPSKGFPLRIDKSWRTTFTTLCTRNCRRITAWSISSAPA